MPDDKIDTSDIPETDEAFLKSAKLKQPKPAAPQAQYRCGKCGHTLTLGYSQTDEQKPRLAVAECPGCKNYREFGLLGK